LTLLRKESLVKINISKVNAIFYVFLCFLGFFDTI
jgi:hypothetical protein